MRTTLAAQCTRTVLVGAAALSLSSVAHASPEDLFGYGTRSPAMAGTGAAYGANFEAAYLNPALLAGLRERRLILGFSGAAFALAATENGAPQAFSQDSAHGYLIGAEVPLPFNGTLTNRIGLALAFYTPNDVIVRGRVLYPERPQFPLLPDRAQSLTLRMGVGADLGYGLAIGVGVAALAEIAGSVIVAQDAGGKVGSKVQDQLVATYAPTLGARYTYGLGKDRAFAVGLSVRGTLDARFAVTIDATKLSSLRIPLFNIAGIAQYDPAQAQLEGSYIDHGRVFSFAIGAKLWSAYPGPIESTIPCPVGEEGCGALEPPKLDVHNTLFVRASGEVPVVARKDARMSLRFGAGFEPTPLPSAPSASERFDVNAPRDARGRNVVLVPTRYFDASRVTLSAGIGIKLGSHVELANYIQWQVLMPRTIEPESGVPAQVSGSILAGGLTAGVSF